MSQRADSLTIATFSSDASATETSNSVGTASGSCETVTPSDVSVCAPVVPRDLVVEAFSCLSVGHLRAVERSDESRSSHLHGDVSFNGLLRTEVVSVVKNHSAVFIVNREFQGVWRLTLIVNSNGSRASAAFQHHARRSSDSDEIGNRVLIDIHLALVLILV